CTKGGVAASPDYW
nr:immunoglobulin heavy chain junction region [Macaca mulatta]